MATHLLIPETTIFTKSTKLMPIYIDETTVLMLNLDGFFFPFSSLVIYIPVSHAHQYCHSRCDHDGSFLWDLLPDCANHGSFRDGVTPRPGHCRDLLSVRLSVQSVFGKLDATNQLLFAMTFITWLANCELVLKWQIFGTKLM